jgi:hypothetical protein
VQPLALDFLLKPGETTNFKITLTPGNTPEEDLISICKAEQQLTGDLIYQVADPATFPLAKWINIPSSVKLNPGNKQEVTGTIKVPLDANGCNVIGIMIEPKQENVKGISVVVRYAIRIMIQVDRPGNRPDAAVTSFNLIKGDKGQPVIAAQVKNNSPLEFMTSANVTIRDSNRRLVERVPLMTGSGLPEFLILPLSELRYTGTPKEVLTPGDYEIRLFYNYASGKQLLFAKNITVKAGDFVYPKSILKMVKITPLEVEFTGSPKTTSIKPIKFENKSDKPVTICLEPAEIEPKYPYSILTKTSLEIKGDITFTLDPGRMATNLIMVKFNEGLGQENYGLIKVHIFSTDEKPKLIEESVINLTAITPGKFNYAAEVLGISGDRTGNQYLISTVILNKGNARISPTAKAVINDSSGKTIETVDLSNEVTDTVYVIPGKQITLSGLTTSLKPGKYKVQVYLVNGKVELGMYNFDLVLK